MRLFARKTDRPGSPLLYGGTSSPCSKKKIGGDEEVDILNLGNDAPALMIACGLAMRSFE